MLRLNQNVALVPNTAASRSATWLLISAYPQTTGRTVPPGSPVRRANSTWLHPRATSSSRMNTPGWNTSAALLCFSIGTLLQQPDRDGAHIDQCRNQQVL